ncbi:hypothetical protein [Streptomyces olivochromogenes]|uniref:hypothetical protein n=1 Tax=Streptomyces olivochromogenes TaxID=1963 RepID=UPI00099E7EBC|nr:hypothetical protein [Streptomyces olivochromogenes]
MPAVITTKHGDGATDLWPTGQAGESEGDYWWCWDGLVVRDAGVPSMVEEQAEDWSWRAGSLLLERLRDVYPGRRSAGVAADRVE